MDYKDLIKKWHNKAAEQDDFFASFVFEYLAFIACLRIIKFPSENPDRSIIQMLKRDVGIKTKYLEKINSDTSLKSNWEHISEKLNEIPLAKAARNLIDSEIQKYWNCSHDKFKDKTPEERRKPTGVIHALDDWENMVEFWYTIRNTLFHGAKNPENERDQFAVKYGYLTLKELVEILLNE